MELLALDRRALLSALAISATIGTRPVFGRAVADPQAALWRGLEFRDKEGRAFQIGTGAPLTLVTMWAHWCPACLVEMASLSALASTLGPATLDIVLVSHPDYWAEDQLVAQRHHLNFRLATPGPGTDQAAVRAALTVDGVFDVPRSLLFRGRDNGIAWTHLGSMDWDAADTVARLRGMAA